MTEKDFNNIEKILQILKFIDKKKLDMNAWTNALELKKSDPIIIWAWRVNRSHKTSPLIINFFLKIIKIKK